MKKNIFKKTIALLMVLTVSLSCMTFSALAADDSSVMTVAVDGGETRNFTSFNDGWIYAMEQSVESHTTLTLFADWVATNGDFYCENAEGDEYGTHNGYLDFDDNHILTIDLNGHKIDRNLDEAKDDGMVFSLTDRDIILTIKDSVGGGEITGGNNTGDGGAFYVYDGALFMEGGEITGNHARNGGGIYWYSDNVLCLTGGRISGNTAEGTGGGIHHEGDGGSIGANLDHVYLGGDVQIYGNSGAGSEKNNLYVDQYRFINLAAGQTPYAVGYTYNIPSVPFTKDALIGISAHEVLISVTPTECDFNYGDDKYFFSDNDKYSVRLIYEAKSERYNMFLDYKEQKDPVMSVTVEGAGEILFTDHGKGWAYAMEQSLAKPTIVKLLADWVATDGKFYATKSNGSEYGTNNGRLYFNDDHVLVINLNGHKIDRNLDEAKSDGMVFYLNDTDIRLTIRDDAGGGKITGGNNTGNGGAFYVYEGGLFIRGGEISGNHAKNGGGIYWVSDNAFFMYHGRITGNTADENGGGIYHDGDGEMLTGATDNMFFGGDVQIYGNSGAGDENNNLYVNFGNMINLTAGQRYSAEGYAYSIQNAPFKEGAVIGVTVERGTGGFSARPSQFNLGDDKYFFSDSDKYSVRMDYDALDECYSLSLAAKTEASDAVMAVTVDGAETSTFTDFNQGWVYAMEQSLDKHTTVKLLADWVAPNGEFYIPGPNGWQNGTSDGALYLNKNFDITIDLNGHKIDRNLSEAKDDGRVFYLNDYECKLTIKDSVGGGKITGGNNTGDGGAFYINSGSLHINGGEISGNYATNGAAVYWCSGGNLCITGGVITNNLAEDNGGAVYITNNGKVYFGGTAVIKNSSRGNVYISDKDANIYHAKGQADGVPDMPLTEGACIGIYASDSDVLISGDNSRFGEDDHKYFFSDSTDHYIRAVYKEGDGNHAYKLYINALTNSETKFPAIESVAVINSELLQSATVNNDTKVITLTGYANKKSSFEQVTLASLISYTFNSDATSVSGSNALYNLSTPTDYKVMSDNGTYTVYTVVVEWVCSEHTDADNDDICDDCGENITISFAIPAYDAATLAATVITPKEGTYTVIFVDFEGGRMENVDTVNYEFSKGVNTVGQEILGFELGKGDKIMLLSGLNTLIPLCEALVIE